MFTKQTIRDIDLKNKTVLLRADFNVPVQDGKIIDDYRIQQSLPTVKYLLDQNVRLIICSHLGRPKGKIDESLSLAPVAKRLQKLLGHPVRFVHDCVGDEVKKAADQLERGQILLLENVRFHSEEEADDAQFAKQLASLAEIYVNDSFAVDHHPAVSVTGIAKYLPAVSGLLLEKEMTTLTQVMEKPKRPLMAVIGGAKIADKLEVMTRFIDIADCVAVGGAMANTFLVANGVKVGESLYDKAEVAVAKDILKKAEREAAKRQFVFLVPHDVVVAEKIDKTAPTRLVELSSNVLADIEHYPQRVPAGSSHVQVNERILDIGPFSASLIAGAIQLTNTVVWSGTMGVTETPSLQGPIGPTAHGTQTIVDAMLGEFGHKPFSVVGGGDTVGYVQSRNLTDVFSHVSTGGSASLEVLAGHKLPGVEALLDKK
ncbi:MAG TPA: phosphoglycerate kinase [Candidatus Saccharimonadales bacterium]|jgi:phosphoglycerate kinase|nr:phosphoglycerate kinase [Candidatus Saccharimonadales bacterium]